MKHVENLCFHWYLICKTTYSKNGLKQRHAVFYGKFENEKKTGQTNFDLPEQGFESQIFSNSIISIFMWS